MTTCHICNKEIKAGTDITTYGGLPAHPDCAIQHHKDAQAKIPQLPVTILHPIPQPDHCFHHHSLRRCPFCGSKAELCYISNSFGEHYYVKCTGQKHFGAGTAPTEDHALCNIVPKTEWFDYSIDAINTWNGRTNNPNATSTFNPQIHKHFNL